MPVATASGTLDDWTEECVQPLYSATYAVTALQKIDPADLKNNELRFIAELMQQFFITRMLIPLGNLVEVRFEGVEANPFVVVGQIYERLNLVSFEPMVGRLNTIIPAHGEYQKNRFTLSADRRSGAEGY